MSFNRITTRRLITLTFGFAAVACLLAGLAGWRSAADVHRANLQTQAVLVLEAEVNASLRTLNELILTSGSKASVEAFQRAQKGLEAQLAGAPASLGEPARAWAQGVAALGAMRKPSPDNDEVMIAYGKLEAQSSALLQQLATLAGEQRLATQLRVDRLVGLALAAGVGLFAAVGAVGWLVARRLHRRLGGELEEAEAVVARVAGGDFSPVPVPPGTEGVLGALARMVAQLAGSIGEVRLAAEQIRQAADEVASGSADLGERTERAAGSLQASAGAIQQVVGSVRQTADHARDANALAAQAAEVAQRGGSQVAEVVNTMERIRGSSQRIGDIIGTIDGIAFQTNILALNAAVEAARAGEQGRGFAVVAAEVRALAQRSAHAAREIKSLVLASVDSVESGVSLVADTGKTIQAIVEQAERVSGVVGGISSAAREQSSGIEQVSGSVLELEKATQQNAALVEQSTAAASMLRDQATRLAEVVQAFKTGAPAAA